MLITNWELCPGEDYFFPTLSNPWLHVVVCLGLRPHEILPFRVSMSLFMVSLGSHVVDISYA